MLQHFAYRFTFVMIPWRYFQHHLPVNETKLGPEFIDEIRNQAPARRLEFRRPSIMQSEARAFLFDEQTLILVGKRPGAPQNFVWKLRLRNDDVVPEAQFCAVRTSGWKSGRLEDPVYFRNRSAADQGKGTVQTLGEADKQIDKRRLGTNVVRVVPDVDERAVDIQEQRRRIGAKIGGWLGHPRRLARSARSRPHIF